MNFVSKTKNPYEDLINTQKEDLEGKFIPKIKASPTVYLRNNTSNICGRKVSFRSVQIKY